MGKYNNIYCNLSENGVSSNLESWQSGMYPEYVERENIGGRRLILNQGDRRVYFRMEQNVVSAYSGCFIKAEVRYFDEGVGHFSIIYNTKNGIVSSVPVLLENTCKWRTAVIYLENALLNRGINAYDFALELCTEKYGISGCHVIFGSLKITDIAKDGAEISVLTDTLAGNTFFEKDKIKFNVRVKSKNEKNYNCCLTVIYENIEDEILQTDEFDVLIGREEISIQTAPEIDKYGCYRM